MRRHDRIVVRLRSGEVEFGIFLRKTAQRLSLGSFSSSGEDRAIAIADVAWQARIICLCAQQQDLQVLELGKRAAGCPAALIKGGITTSGRTVTRDRRYR